MEISLEIEPFSKFLNKNMMAGERKRVYKNRIPSLFFAQETVFWCRSDF